MKLEYRTKIIIVIAIAVIVIATMIVEEYLPKDTSASSVSGGVDENIEKKLFPGILGDTILKSKDTGIYYINSIVTYDDFRGEVIQGYKVNYTGSNGSTIIFVAQMTDNVSANKSLKDMVSRTGYNQSSNDLNLTYNKTIKLPVDNPEVFVIQKDTAQYHYSFFKKDKVYWIGFSSLDVQYQIDMLIEIYQNIDEEKEKEEQNKRK